MLSLKTCDSIDWHILILASCGLSFWMRTLKSAAVHMSTIIMKLYVLRLPCYFLNAFEIGYCNICICSSSPNACDAGMEHISQETCNKDTRISTYIPIHTATHTHTQTYTGTHAKVRRIINRMILLCHEYTCTYTTNYGYKECILITVPRHALKSYCQLMD